MKQNKVIFAFIVFCLFGHSALAKVMAKNERKKKTHAREVSENKLLYLNAANFDFNGKLISNYVGHLNIFAPDIGGSLFGFNTGLMKLNYSNLDTLQESYRIENALINPLKNLQAGDKYLRQLNKYKIKPSNTTWSFYAQPMRTMYTFPKGAGQIYLHGHLELLVQKLGTSAAFTNVQTDTLVYNNDPNFVARGNITNESNYTSTRLGGYFGAGVTFNFSPWDKGSVFFQGTTGITTDRPNLYTYYGSHLYLTSSSGLFSFYLVRAYYTQFVSDNATIIIGSDIRGLLPRYSPMYAAYLGLNLKIQGVLGLLGLDKDGKEKADDGEGKKKKKKKESAAEQDRNSDEVLPKKNEKVDSENDD